VLCKVYGFCEYISFAGNETCMLTSFSNDKMYAIADSVAWLHFAVFFALKKKGLHIYRFLVHRGKWFQVQ
jgi:hypothetical protein